MGAWLVHKVSLASGFEENKRRESLFDTMKLCDRLRGLQYESENPTAFEEALTQAFNELGLDAKHLGGKDEPDVLLQTPKHAIVDGKTAKEGTITEGYVNFEAIERHKEKHKAQHAALVAPRFAEGNIRKTARKKCVSLIETESICKALEWQNIYPYTPRIIFGMLFDLNREVITTMEIKPSIQDMDRHIELISVILSGLEHLRKPSFTLNQICNGITFQGLDYTEDEVEKALSFLSTPPLAILKREVNDYRLPLGIEEVKKSLGMMFAALKFPTSIPGTLSQQVQVSTGAVRPEGKVTAGDFIHKGNGIFVLKSNQAISLDVKKPSKVVQMVLSMNRLLTINPGSFYYYLRRKAGLLHTPPQE